MATVQTVPTALRRQRADQDRNIYVSPGRAELTSTGNIDQGHIVAGATESSLACSSDMPAGARTQPLSPMSIVKHSVAIRAPPGARLGSDFPQDATGAGRIVDGIAAELTKLARAGSCFGECEPIIALVCRSRCEEIGFVASFFVY